MFMSKGPDWRQALLYSQSAENWKESGEREGPSPSAGQAPATTGYLAVPAAPGSGMLLFLFCFPEAPVQNGSPSAARERLLAALDTQPGAAGHVLRSGPWPCLPLTSPSLSRVPPQERPRACVRRRGDFHPFPVGAEISRRDRGTSTARQPSGAGGQPVPRQKGDDAAARLPSERCLPLSPAAPSPNKARRAPEPRDRLCVPRHAAQPRQPRRKSDGCETRA